MKKKSQPKFKKLKGSPLIERALKAFPAELKRQRREAEHNQRLDRAFRKALAQMDLGRERIQSGLES